MEPWHCSAILLFPKDRAQIIDRFAHCSLCDFFKFIKLLVCTTANFWPFLCRSSKIWSLYGGFSVDPRLFRLTDDFLFERLVFGRVFFQYLGACIIQPVRWVDSFTVFVTVGHHPSKIRLSLEEIWVKSGYLPFYIYCMRFVLLLGMFVGYGSLVFTLFSSGLFIWDC